MSEHETNHEFESTYIPPSLDDLKSKLDEKNIAYQQWKDDKDRGPERLFEDIEKGKCQLVETRDTLLRSSRVVRARITTLLDDEKYKLRLTKKQSNKTGETVDIKEDEKIYAVSKGLHTGEDAKDALVKAIKEDTKMQGEIHNPEILGSESVTRPPNKNSKIPWISSRYDFETYEVSVDTPPEDIHKEMISVGQAWTTTRTWTLVEEDNTEIIKQNERNMRLLREALTAENPTDAQRELVRRMDYLWNRLKSVPGDN